METDDVQEVFDQAGELLEKGRPEESLQSLEVLSGDLLEGDERIEYVSLRAWALSELGRIEQALDELESLIEEHPRSARLHATRGIVLSNDGDLNEACAALEHAITLDAGDEVATANLGLVYEKLRRYDNAAELYDRAIELGAEIDWLLQRKAAVQIEVGELAAARSTLSRYLSLAPDDVEQWITLAILHSDELEFDEAFRCYRAAEQIAPDSTALRLNWAVTAVRAHRIDVARQQLTYLARLEPDSSRPLLLEALIKEEEDELDTAARLYADALARVRRDDYAELTYALEMSMGFFARQGRVASCEQLLEQAYVANACTVELCEAYREAGGPPIEHATWYSLLVEGDYRPGLHEITDPGDAVNRPHTRFLRNYQVIARDHDEALMLVMRLLNRMGESNALVREFVSEEAITDARVGVYEVERESLVLTDASLR